MKLFDISITLKSLKECLDNIEIDNSTTWSYRTMYSKLCTEFKKEIGSIPAVLSRVNKTLPTDKNFKSNIESAKKFCIEFDNLLKQSEPNLNEFPNISIKLIEKVNSYYNENGLMVEFIKLNYLLEGLDVSQLGMLQNDFTRLISYIKFYNENPFINKIFRLNPTAHINSQLVAVNKNIINGNVHPGSLKMLKRMLDDITGGVK